MRFEFTALPWELLGKRPVMVTLTYPREWELWVPDARALHRHREALKERWRRRYGAPMGVWVTEFQRRGAPHLHMYLALPDEVSQAEYIGLQQRTIRRKGLERRLGAFEARRRLRAPKGDFSMWLRTAWWEVVGSELRAHHGRGVDIATAFFSEQAEERANRTRVAEYFWRESGKWAQKIPPEGFGGMKFYGRWGKKEGFTPQVSTTELTEAVGLELRRMMRRMMRGKMRENAARMGRSLPRNAGRSRGRDGLSVFGVDGTVWGPRLRECAERVALEKAERRSDEERQVLLLHRQSMRAFSELPIDPDPVPMPGDELDAGWAPDEHPDPPLSWEEEEEELAFETAVEAIERQEAAEDAAYGAWLEEQFREMRRAELRRTGGWTGPSGGKGRSGGRRRPQAAGGPGAACRAGVRTDLAPAVGPHSGEPAQPLQIGHYALMSSVEVVGIYPVEAPERCHLVEVIVRQSEGPLDLDQFTQADDQAPRADWQAPYAEKLLDPSGDWVEWDFWDGPGEPAMWRGDIRLVFFLHHLDTERPLTTPFGEVLLPPPTERPTRLNVIDYQEP